MSGAKVRTRKEADGGGSVMIHVGNPEPKIEVISKIELRE